MIINRVTKIMLVMFSYLFLILQEYAHHISHFLVIFHRFCKSSFFRPIQNAAMSVLCSTALAVSVMVLVVTSSGAIATGHVKSWNARGMISGGGLFAIQVVRTKGGIIAMIIIALGKSTWIHVLGRASVGERSERLMIGKRLGKCLIC